MRVVMGVLLAAAVASGARAGYGGGGGGGGGGGSESRPEADCLVGLWNAPSGATIACTDCDPACDADGTGAPNGSCAFRVQVCANFPGLGDCEPASLRSISAKPKKLFPPGTVPLVQQDDGSACGAFTEVIVRTRKGGIKPGKKKLRLAARSEGKPVARDKDAYRLVCNPAPAGESCGAAACTIDMDTSCPDTTAVCGAAFAGGGGCLFEGKTGCYDSGTQAYRVTSAEPLTITVDPPVTALEVFFVAEGAAAGTMTFRDATGAVVGSPLTTNGDCLAGMPSRQQVSFPAPVAAIDVTAGGGPVWVDSVRLTR
ncbi:MAG TPA: hypothetical protein VNO26_13200 [Candidatus Limnocylindria bacterium]|nr:hypothetical protein [Candidatus Limnocylindria bacterium]